MMAYFLRLQLGISGRIASYLKYQMDPMPFPFQFNEAISVASRLLDASGRGAPSHKDCKC
jgi:hypothetical protein